MNFMGVRRQKLLAICLAGIVGCGENHRSDESARSNRQARQTAAAQTQQQAHDQTLAQPRVPGFSQPLGEPRDMRLKKPSKPKKSREPNTETPIEWFSSYVEARQEAKRTGKPLFVVFR